MWPTDARLCQLFRRHWRRTVTFWSVFFSFGLCLAFLGPTVLDLRCQTRSTLQQITWVFFSQQFCLLLGSGLGGLPKKTLGVSLWSLLSCTLLISAVFALIPLCRHVAPLSVTMAIAGVAMGVIDTVANQQLVRLYHKDSATFLQALHFFIGLGALVSPLVAEPFLAEDSCVVGANGTANSSWDLQHLRRGPAGHGAPLHGDAVHGLHTQGAVVSRVRWAFWIMALINLPVPAAVLALMHYERLLPCFRDNPPLLSRDSDAEGDGWHGDGGGLSCCRLEKLRGRPPTFFLLHVLGGAILFLTDGIIGSYAGFVYTYAVSPPLAMSHHAAGLLDSVFWAAITAGRLAFIYLSTRCSAPRLLSASMVGVVVVQCCLLIFYSSRVFLFLGTCVLGLCISSVFPSLLAFTEDILDYKGCATMVLVTSASTGEMLLQLLVGSVIHRHGSYSFILCGTMASFVALGLFLLLLFVRHVHTKRHPDSSPDTNVKEGPDQAGAS